VWRILQDKVYKTCMTDLDDLKHRHGNKVDLKLISWITLSLQLLCNSDVVVSQGASRPTAVILSTVFF